ncbi:MAG: hypothetical protein ACHQQQ_05890 [Bacteroidota bacterium]
MASVVEVNKCSVLVRVGNNKLRNMQGRMVRRREIRRFSGNSKKRLARLLLNNAEKFKYFFTVTYRANQRDCRISKIHIDRFLTRFRKACGSKVGYVWALEFQKRGAVHFHLWFENFRPHIFMEWKALPVRKKIALRFKDCAEDLERFKFLTYLWLRVTGQLGDEKAVRAATDLKVITTSNFVVNYAIKYAWKSEQKDVPALINYETGEIIDNWWVGRFWGASRSVQNEKMYYSTNDKAIRIIRKWLGKNFGKKSFSGLWFMKPELRERLFDLCDRLDVEQTPRQNDLDELAAEIRHDWESMGYQVCLRWMEKKVIE